MPDITSHEEINETLAIAGEYMEPLGDAFEDRTETLAKTAGEFGMEAVCDYNDQEKGTVEVRPISDVLKQIRKENLIRIGKTTGKVAVGVGGTVALIYAWKTVRFRRKTGG